MQLLNTINLSIVATLLLQSGRFVGAMPLFGARVDNAHSNGVSGETCEALRINYPSTRTNDITYEDGSKHVIAWYAPEFLTQLDITLVNNDSGNTISIGTFDAIDGATDEIPISFGDNNAGEYHYRISGQGDGQFCETNSGNFKINKRTTDVHDNDSGSSSLDDDNKDQVKTTAFKEYIDSLDQDIDKFIHKNKETETERVTHKNDVDTSNTNGKSWTGDGAHVDAVSQTTSWVSNDDQHNNKSDWTGDGSHTNAAPATTSWVSNDDQHNNKSEWTGDGSHTNAASVKDASWVSNDDQHNNKSEWTGDGSHTNDASVKDASWVSEDEHTNGWTGDGNHVNAAVQDSKWESEDQHTNGWTGDGSHVNLDDLKEESPEWQIVESDNEPAAANSDNTSNNTPAPTHSDFTNTWEDTSDHVNTDSVTHSDFTNTWQDTSDHVNHVDEPVTHSDFTNTWEDTSNHVNTDSVTHSDFTNTWQDTSDSVKPATHSDFTSTWEDTSDHVNESEAWVDEFHQDMNLLEFDHSNSGWATENDKHTNSAGWTAEDDKHTNSADWTAEEDNHSNSAGWTAEEDNHSNSAGWTADEHSNSVGSEWVTEDEPSVHRNGAVW